MVTEEMKLKTVKETGGREDAFENESFAGDSAETVSGGENEAAVTQEENADDGRAEDGEDGATEKIPGETDTGASTPTEDVASEEDGATDTASDDGLAAEKRMGALASVDYDALCESFPSARAYPSLADIPGATRFSELRELGLSVDEAARAAMPEVVREVRHAASRDARVASMPSRSEATRGGMSYGEMAMARDLFSGLSTKELLSLYRRVNQ